MFAGPIFAVEVVTGARRARYYIVRVVYASILLVTMWIAYTEAFYGNPSNIRADAARAAAFFNSFAVVQLLAVLLIGPAMVAGTIAQERERRTIEYLLTADLSNSEIVLGKLAARLLYIIFALLVGLPILALVGLMGGVRPEDQLLVFILTTSTTLAVSSLSMAVSVWARRTRDAMARIYLILIALLIVPLVARFTLPWLPVPAWLEWALDWLVYLNEGLLAMDPIVVFYAVLWGDSLSVLEIWQQLWPMLAGHLLTSLVCLLLAVTCLRRAYLSSAGVSEQPGKVRGKLWRPPVGSRAMLWKELFAERRSMRLGWVARVAVLLLVASALGPSVWMFANTGGTAGGTLFAGQMVAMSTFVATLGVVMVAARAATSVTAEKERDCWVSLISTPLSGGEIVTAKLLGNLYSARWLFLMMALLWGLAVLRLPEFLLAVPFLATTLLVLCLFASCLGLIFSLWCRNSLRSLGATLGVGVYIGGGYMFCCMPILIGSSGGDEVIMFFSAVIPFLLALPGVAAVEIAQSGQFFQGGENFVFVAYVFGMTGYLVAGLMLLASCVGNFDSFAGRNTGIRPAGYRPRSARPAGAARATIVQPPPRRINPPPPD